MSISKYNAFIQVVETGSLTKAARVLGYSQPGISHMIDSLEKEMGFQLLIRAKDKVFPTENGKKVLYYCLQIIKNETYLQETVSAINGLMEGSIRLGAYNSMLSGFVPYAIRDFSQLYSKIEFHIQEASFGELQEYLTQGTLDMAFMMNSVPKGFSFIPLFRDRATVIVPADHPFVQYEKLTPAMLNGCDFIMHSSGFDDVVNTVLTKAPFQPNVRYYAGSDVAVYMMVANRMGISIISSLQTGLVPDNVVCKELDGSFSRDLGIALKSLRHASPAIREFVRIAKETADKMGLTSGSSATPPRNNA